MSALRNPIFSSIRRLPGKLALTIRHKKMIEDDGPTYVGFSRDDSCIFDKGLIADTEATYSPTPSTDPDSGHGSCVSDFVDANSDIDYDDSDSDFEHDYSEPQMPPKLMSAVSHGSSAPGFVDTNSGIDYDDDSDYDDHVSEPSSCPQMPLQPKSDHAMNLLDLPTNVLENIISKLDTGSLHAFRNTSSQAAKASEFRGIQAHFLHVDPEMAPGQIHSIQRKGKVHTRASLAAVLNTERVKVRHLLRIGAFHAASAQLIADHIDSRFTSIVFEGHVYYKTLYSLIVPGKTVTLRLKDGIRLPSSDASRFWNFFPGQPISEVRQCFNSSHVIVKATYDVTTDSHSLRAVPVPCSRLTVDL